MDTANNIAKAPSRTSIDLIDTIDLLNEARQINEAAHMACGSIPHRKHREALQHVIGSCSDIMRDATDKLEAVQATVMQCEHSMAHPKIATAEDTFAAMTCGELFDVIAAILSSHHSFNQQGQLYSSINDGWERMQSWCDGYCDQLQGELRMACDEYLSRRLDNSDDIENRNLALAGAYRIASGAQRPFSVAIVVTSETAGA